MYNKMQYTDFYRIAEYGSKNWRGNFTPAEIAENAYIYKVTYDAYGLRDRIMQDLIYLLEMDGSDEAKDFLYDLRKGVNV